MRSNRLVFASRDISSTSDRLSELKGAIESILDMLKCEILLSIQAGRLRIEFVSHNESEVKECDLKLTSKIISFRETNNIDNIVLYPFIQNWDSI